MVQSIKITGKKPIETKKSEIQIVKRNEDLFAEGIPDNHELEYVAKNDGSIFFVVHRPSKDWNYNSFRLHIGPVSELVEAKVDSVERYRDGGTTDIRYTLNEITGNLHFPTPFNKDKNPTNSYDGKEEKLEKIIE
mgnify:CR=1 FL=1